MTIRPPGDLRFGRVVVLHNSDGIKVGTGCVSFFRPRPDLWPSTDPVAYLEVDTDDPAILAAAKSERDYFLVVS